MSGTWTGSALRTRFLQKYGFSDTTSGNRILEWLNEWQEDMSRIKWPELKMKLKKYIASGVQEIDLAPQIPSAPTLAALAGGALTSGSACLLKVTFVLFDETGREFGSIESEPSSASNSITPASTDLSLTVTGIDTFDGSSGVNPATIHRRLYLSQAAGDYYLVKTLEDNTTTTTIITANPSGTIEPPEFSMVEEMSSEPPQIEASGVILSETTMGDILSYDPGLSSTGLPTCFARISKSKIFLYPRPSSAITLSYWSFKKPQRIFNDSSRIIQLSNDKRRLADAYVTWKGHEQKDSDGGQTKFDNYESLKSDFKASSVSGGIAETVRRVI